MKKTTTRRLITATVTLGLVGLAGLCGFHLGLVGVVVALVIGQSGVS